MKELDITSTTLGALQVSIFLFAFSIEPLVLAPLSEIHGRTIILHVGNIIFIAFTVGCAVSQTVRLQPFSTYYAADQIDLSLLNWPFVVSFLA